MELINVELHFHHKLALCRPTACPIETVQYEVMPAGGAHVPVWRATAQSSSITDSLPGHQGAVELYWATWSHSLMTTWPWAWQLAEKGSEKDAFIKSRSQSPVRRSERLVVMLWEYTGWALCFCFIVAISDSIRPQNSSSRICLVVGKKKSSFMCLCVLKD